MYALPASAPAASLKEAPIIKSPYPSPFTSPAAETEFPKLSPEAYPVKYLS